MAPRKAPSSNSATIASTLNSSRPTGSVGSWTEPPMLSWTSRLVRSSRISRASGSDRARRTLAIGPGQAVIGVRVLGAHAEPCQCISLRREILIVSLFRSWTSPHSWSTINAGGQGHRGAPH